MKLLPVLSLNALPNASISASLNAWLTKIIKTVETTALDRSNQRHILHYLLKGLGDLPTPVLERLNHYINPISRVATKICNRDGRYASSKRMAANKC